MQDDMVKKLLAGATLGCVMQPDDEIPTNQPLHDECFQLPHIIVDDENFTAITYRDIVTKPGIECPIVFYYSNYFELFGTFSPITVEPGFGGDSTLRLSYSPRRRYRKFSWVVKENFTKIWDSQGDRDFRRLRTAVSRATPMKVVFLDEEGVWNIHPVILPQVESREGAFMIQTAYITYPITFRETTALIATIREDEDLTQYVTDAKQCFTSTRVVHPKAFYAFYHLMHDGTYKSYYDLFRGNTSHVYGRLMVFAEI